MKCLFIDTSYSLLSLALVEDDKVIAETSYDSMNEHSKYTMMGIDKIFKESSMEPHEVDKIMVVNGPGSFTGIRIGVTIAKVYAWALNKKVIPISTLKAYALSNSGYDYYISVLDARRDHVYAGIYSDTYSNIIEEQYISINKLKEIIKQLSGSLVIVGDVTIDEKEKTIPIKLDILKIIKYYADTTEINVHQLNPNYLKMVEAEEKLRDMSKQN